MYRIDKDVPIPETRKAGKYPFHNMEVGDSFFALPEEEQSLRKLQISIAGCIRKRRHSRLKSGLPANAHFVTQQSKKNGGVRCWRVK